MAKRKRYTQEHKELFTALFQGTADVDSSGKVVVNGKLWDWADPDVQYFVRRARQMKKDINELVRKELESIFGRD